MQTVTKELIKNHRVLRHLIGRLTLTNKRYREVLKTTTRVQAAHVWFEGKFLFPKLRKSPQISSLFLKSITNEQKLLKAMIAQLGRIKSSQNGKFKNHLLQVMEVKGKESFVMRNGKFIARINYASKSKIRRLYTEWSNLKAIPILEKSVKKYSKKIKVETGKISIKHQESRWGSLSKKGTLNFNQNLIRAPPKIVDYVAAHEVCHFKIPNRGVGFGIEFYA